MPDPREHIGPNTCLKYHAIQSYIVLALSLNGEDSLGKLNNSRIQIQIRIFTKIESIRPCYTHNVSSKFYPNPSITFWDTVLYIGLANSLNGEESLKNFETRIQIRIRIFTNNSSVSHTQRVHQVSYESVHHFLRYRALSFLALSLNGEESLKKL